nr:MAG TPA: hypothetical protein [Caudoviricetes sp.]
MFRKEKARKRFCFWFIIFILYLFFDCIVFVQILEIPWV